MIDPLKPSIQLLVKLGSIVVHADELTSKGGHPMDAIAIRSGMDDLDVREWIDRMGELLPLKRKVAEESA